MSYKKLIYNQNGKIIYNDFFTEDPNNGSNSGSGSGGNENEESGNGSGSNNGSNSGFQEET